MDEIRLRARVPAAIAQVWHALTDADALRTWLAEHAEVELPHRYEFWGRFTPEGKPPRQRLIHVGDHTLRFAWLLDSAETTVEIRLDEEAPASTLVTLTQTGPTGWVGTAAATSTPRTLHTFWALAVANLADHVEGRPLTGRCDFTSPRMHEHLVIDASPRAVWESIVDPEAFASWFGARIDIEPYVGGRWSMGGFHRDPSPATVVELDAEHTFAIRWPQGLVTTWELAESDGRTRLTFTQSGFADPPYDSWMGWLGGLAELRRFHERDGWQPMWLEVHVPDVPRDILTIDAQEA